MKVQVQTWGNSLALRIPKSFAVETKIGKGTIVEMSIVQGKIVVTPATEPEYTLEELLNGVKKKNLHGETDTGTAVGKEVW